MDNYLYLSDLYAVMLDASSIDFGQPRPNSLKPMLAGILSDLYLKG